ncbi:MAG TPA: hypothetical protein VJ327_02610 [Patescibacteria group bacterium]|nr:hypothetical protein [Patescibacteria group bacterium]
MDSMKIYIPLYLKVAGQKNVTVYIPYDTSDWTDRQAEQFDELTYQLTLQGEEGHTVSNSVLEFVSNLPGSTVVVH